jgi:hypothetical protein
LAPRLPGYVLTPTEAALLVLAIHGWCRGPLAYPSIISFWGSMLHQQPEFKVKNPDFNLEPNP